MTARKRNRGGGIGAMFDGIARSYDPLNRLLSLGSDRRWRQILVRLAGSGPEAQVLDVCTGTADLPLAFVRARAAAGVTGVDLSPRMLAAGWRKVRRAGAGSTIALLEADALRLPCADRSFDVVSNAFGLRNLPDRERGVREMVRVLRPGGRLLLLEFSPPGEGVTAAAFRRYLSVLIPLAGGILSGRPRAYRYLRDSIESFLRPADVAALMRDSGLTRVRVLPLTAGIVHLYRGVRSVH